MYEEMGNRHTNKDIEVNWDEVMVRQRKVTGLTRCLVKALGVGEAWEAKNIVRCKNSYHTLSGVAQILTVTPKDHKPHFININVDYCHK